MGYRHIATGESLEQALSTLDADEVYRSRPHEHHLWATNTGQLFTTWLMLRFGSAWQPARVWDAELGERWILVSDNEIFPGPTGELAFLQFREKRNALELIVAEELARKHPDNEFHRKELEEVLKTRAELEAIRTLAN